MTYQTFITFLHLFHLFCICKVYAWNNKFMIRTYKLIKNRYNIHIHIYINIYFNHLYIAYIFTYLIMYPLFIHSIVG